MVHSPIIIFDVDGVLLSSKGHFLLSIRYLKDKNTRWNYELLQSINSVDIIRLLEEGAKQRSIPSAKTIYQNFVELIPSKLRRWRFLYRFKKNIGEYDWKYNEFFSYSLETIQKLKELGFIIGAASNSSGSRIEKWFRRYGVSDVFKFRVSRDYRKIYGVKPSPGPLYWVLVQMKRFHKLGKIDRSRVAFVGDLPTDIMAGKNAKVKTIGVLSGHSSVEELTDLKTDFIFNNISDIIPNLDKIFPGYQISEN